MDRLRTHNGGEFYKYLLKEWPSTRGVTQEFTPPQSPSMVPLVTEVVEDPPRLATQLHSQSFPVVILYYPVCKVLIRVKQNSLSSNFSVFNENTFFVATIVNIYFVECLCHFCYNFSIGVF